MDAVGIVEGDDVAIGGSNDSGRHVGKGEWIVYCSKKSYMEIDSGLIAEAGAMNNGIWGISYMCGFLIKI